MSNPLISIILPVYNGEKHLSECINSILSQTFTDFEFIIVDDASTDGTPNLLEKFAQSDNRIKIITHEKNSRQTVAANTACKHANGKYIARIDADDIALPNRLEEQFNFLENNLGIGVVGSWVDIIDNTSNVISSWNPQPLKGCLSWSLLFGNIFAHSSVMFRLKIAEEVGFYQSPEAEDFDLWSKMSRISGIGCVPKTIQQRRVWEGQLNLKVPQETLECVYQIMQKNINHTIGKSISINKIKNVRKLIVGDSNQLNQEEIIDTKNIVIDLYKTYLKKFKLDKKEKRLIAKDVALKLFSLAKHQKQINSIKGLMALISIVSIDKKFMFYILLRKFIGRNKLENIQQRLLQRINYIHAN